MVSRRIVTRAAATVAICLLAVTSSILPLSPIPASAAADEERHAPDVQTERQADAQRVEASLLARAQSMLGSAVAGPQYVRVIVEAARPVGAVEAVQSAGGAVEGQSKSLVQARVPVNALVPLSIDPAVIRVREPLQFTVAGTMSEALSKIGAAAWTANGYDGAGVKVAVLDRGFAGYAGLLGGDLPASVVTRSFRGDGDIEAGERHGAAMAEVVHDVAPGAGLLLVNFDTEVEFANAVDWILGQGVPVVVSGVNWFNAGPGDGSGFVDGVVAEAANAGILWVNSAGDSATRHWSGPFVDSRGKGWNNFTPQTPGQAFELNGVGVASGQRVQAFLSWDDWTAVNQDYDLYLFRGGCTGQSGSVCEVAAYSNNAQGGGAGQQPVESIDYSIPTDDSQPYWLAIRQASATRDVYFHLCTAGQQLGFSNPSGSLLAPADASAALAVGATALNDDSLRSFSAQGSTTDGRTKPDLSAPDGVSTATYGTAGFGGTSAAAAHVAGAAALVKQSYPDYTGSQVRAFIVGRARDLGAAGADNQFGAGLLQLGTPPQPHLLASPTGLAFIMPRNGSAPQQALQIRPGTATWSIVNSMPWLILSRTSGTGAATVTVSLQTGGLSPGLYTGQLEVRASGTVEGSVLVPVRLIVADRVWYLSLPVIRKNFNGGW